MFLDLGSTPDFAHGRKARVNTRLSILVIAGIAVQFLAGCGGGGSSSQTSVTPPPPATKYTIGGTVSGLSGTGLVLQDNGTDNLSVSANGAFTFATSIASGSSYSVSVMTQPGGPTQKCTVTNGSGTISGANITNVQVVCVTSSFTVGGTVSSLSGSGLVIQNNGGDNLAVSANGAFTFATAIASGHSYNVTVLTQPGNPSQNCVVTNGSGTVGGANIANVAVDCGGSGTGVGPGEWAWMAGSQQINQKGVYGTEGSPAAGNIPGARSGSSTWTDAAGNVWLFGGIGDDSSGAGGSMNDLWMYNSGQWTWVSGSNLVNQPGNYGTQGIAAASNIPGARSSATSGIDRAGNVWLFGGFGVDSTGGQYPLNDLWEYSNGEWTWVSGSNLHSQKGVYGTVGVATSSNVPGARFEAQMWVDPSGALWLFGGNGLDSTGTYGALNDLWKYSSGQWTWMGGSNVINQAGVYGTQGTPASTNVPGARTGAAVWTDAAGNLWLFGGGGFDSTGANGPLDDFWKYSAGQWTWKGGSNLANEAASYGTKGVASPSNTPGGRRPNAWWYDAAGDLWIFGGSIGGGTTQVWFNDLWKYSGGVWTWVGGSNIVNQPGVYGTLGVASSNNIPSARQQSVAWIDQSGKLWLFGGLPYTYGNLNDLWVYQP